MIIFAKIISIAIIGMGTVIALNPKVLLAVLNFWRQDKRIYLAGILRLAFGALFLSISSSCRLPLVVSILGILMIIGGSVIFIIGPARMKAVFIWWEKAPALVMRLAGLMALTIGAALFYSV